MWHNDAGDRVVTRAFTIASDRGRGCRPVDLLAAVAEDEGPVGGTLRTADGGPLFPETLRKPGLRGGFNGYLAAQAIGAAGDFAEARGESLEPAHLLVAVLDQADPEVVATLAHANISAGDVRAVALDLLGAPPELPPLPMPPFPAAGTWDRPPLEISDLDSGAWASLCWRQQRLPLSRLRREWHWSALWSLEHGAAWRVANRFHVDEDQR